MNTEKMPLEKKIEPSCLLICSSCGSNNKQEDKKHCFWEEDLERGTQLICFDCYMENETIIRDFGF